MLYMDLLERAAPLRSRPEAKAVVQAQEEELDDLGVVPMWKLNVKLDTIKSKIKSKIK